MQASVAGRNDEVLARAVADTAQPFTGSMEDFEPLLDPHRNGALCAHRRGDMADTLDALVAHLRRRLETPKIVVWAHNSHVGDAHATEMGDAGECNIGQLVRERHAGDAVLIGFSTYMGGGLQARNGAAEPLLSRSITSAIRRHYAHR